jgi:hypothetical protein
MITDAESGSPHLTLASPPTSPNAPVRDSVEVPKGRPVTICFSAGFSRTLASRALGEYGISDDTAANDFTLANRFTIGECTRVLAGNNTIGCKSNAIIAGLCKGARISGSKYIVECGCQYVFLIESGIC